MAPSSHRARHRVDLFAPTVEVPRGLILQNRFQKLCTEQESEGEDEDTCTGDYYDVDGLDILMPDKVINGVGRKGMLVSAGPAESVLPRDMLQHETLDEGAPKKSFVTYGAEDWRQDGQLREETCALQEGGAERHQQHGFPGHRCGQTFSFCATDP